MKTRWIVLLIAAAMLGGCATNQVAVTYYSDPPGATVTSGGKNFGRTPVTLTYTTTEAERKQGKVSAAGVRFQWPSGAAVSYSSVNVPLNINNPNFVVKRPQNEPGLATDLSYALELEKLELAKRQAAAAEDAAYEARRAARAAEDSARAQKKASENSSGGTFIHTNKGSYYCTGSGLTRFCD